MSKRVDRLAVAVDDVQHARGRAGLGQELGEPQRAAGILLGWLQDERVPAGDRDREHPHRHHGREVEWRDAGGDADRLAQRPAVDAAPDRVAVLALQQLRDAAGELDDLEPARDLAARIGEHLAVLARDDRGELAGMLLDQVAEPEQDARAAERRRVRPLGEGRARRGDRLRASRAAEASATSVAATPSAGL